MSEIVCRFQTLDGTSMAFYIDSSTTGLIPFKSNGKV